MITKYASQFFKAGYGPVIQTPSGCLRIAHKTKIKVIHLRNQQISAGAPGLARLMKQNKAIVVLLDTGTPGTSRVIFSEDADDGTRTRNPSITNRVL